MHTLTHNAFRAQPPPEAKSPAAKSTGTEAATSAERRKQRQRLRRRLGRVSIMLREGRMPRQHDVSVDIQSDSEESALDESSENSGYDEPWEAPAEREDISDDDAEAAAVAGLLPPRFTDANVRSDEG